MDIQGLERHCGTYWHETTPPQKLVNQPLGVWKRAAFVSGAVVAPPENLLLSSLVWVGSSYLLRLVKEKILVSSPDLFILPVIDI